MFMSKKNPKKSIGIIGYGNMGSSIGERIKDNYSVYVFEKDSEKIKNNLGVTCLNSLTELFNKSEIIILAVKPQDFNQILEEMKDSVKNKLIISIAAGKTTISIESILNNARVIRVMPNLAAKIGKAMSCLCKGKFATQDDLKLSVFIFNFVGETLVIDEKMMNACTAVSGSGPGFFFELIKDLQRKDWERFAGKEFKPKLKTSAKNIGFNDMEAEILAASTTGGALEMLRVSVKDNVTAEQLRNQVTSKGGTTEAGLKILNSNLENLDKAVNAALKRAEELSK